MKSFKEFYTEDQIDEGMLSGLVTLISGTIAAIGGLALAAPVTTGVGVALVVGGVIEAVTGDIDKGKGNDGAVTSFVKNKFEEYKAKKYMKNMTEEQAQKIIDETAKRKSKLTGAYKGAVTKLENELTKAFESQDSAKIAKILQKFEAKLPTEEV